MPPNRKRVNKTLVKTQHTNTASKVGQNTNKGSYLNANGESLSSENESCDGSKMSNISENSLVLSDAQNSEHENLKEGHSKNRNFLNANEVTNSDSAKQSREKNSFTTNTTLQNRSSDSDADSDAESRKQILRSAEKRIIRKVSTSESDCRNKRVCDRNESSSESDSAPEDVTFETGRKMVLEVNKQRVDSIQQAKLRRKQQRKNILENYKKQKEEKLLRLKQQQKNVIDASDSSSTESISKVHRNPNSVTLNNTNSTIVSNKIYFSSESDAGDKKSSKQQDLKNATKGHRNIKRLSPDVLDNLQDPVVYKKKKAVDSVENYNTVQLKKCQFKVKNPDLQWDTDYIPLDSSTVTQFGVIPLDKPRKKTIGEEAAAFRQNLLYGDKVKRAPATLNSIRQQKLKVCGMDRLVTRPV